VGAKARNFARAVYSRGRRSDKTAPATASPNDSMKIDREWRRRILPYHHNDPTR
jgi:hypothetical protein